MVEVHYNLVDERLDRTYSINLYTSKDNFIQPMENVHGDVGIDIAVGNNKVVYWNALEEFGSDFTGDISLELKGNYYVPFINVDGISEGKVFKRGVEHDFTWTGGRGDNVLLFELYKDGNLIIAYDERANVGNTKLSFPRKVKPGEGYRLKISDANNRDEVVFTEEFTIERKIPVFLQITGGALVGAGLVVLYYTTRDLQDIPEPPTPSR